MWKCTILLLSPCLLSLLMVACSPTTFSHRTKEHKVHNIMLYPEKHSWCKTTPIKQIVTHPGCHSVEMENNVCVGACFSFSVPRTIPETPGDDRLHYCDSCQPSVIAWTTVLLDCPENTIEPKISKMVEMIDNCSCATYTNSRIPNSATIQYSSVDSAASEEEEVEEAVADDEEGGNNDSEIDDQRLVDDPVADNIIPKFHDIKDFIMRHKVRLDRNITATAVMDDSSVPQRPANVSNRDKILNSPDHLLLLQKLQYESKSEN